ncbi:hypothetical protein B0H10DRAFT_1845868 [Mycena sp. CBHHK59/15]|nr:hypothetical protein B0H10DRAFT_1845868 [Mycena sp. CBHHK59/15]
MHDCYTRKNEAARERPHMREHVESDTTENLIVHAPLDQFIINFHAFHNAHILHAALHRDLLAPIPLFEDRKAKHNEFTATLRENWALRTDCETQGRCCRY